MIPAGKYSARAIGGVLGETKAGLPNVVVEFQLLNEGFQHESIQWFGYFTEKTEERTLQALRFIGWTGTDLSDLSELATRDDLPAVELVVEHDTYEGKTRAKVAWVNQPGAVRAKPMAADKTKSFAAQMKAKLLATDHKHGLNVKPMPPVTRDPPQGHPASEDIPF